MTYSSKSHLQNSATMKFTAVALVITFLMALGGCSSAPKEDATEQELYEEARKAIRLKNFPQATLALEDLEAKYPFGKYAEQAQLDLIYARYSNLDLEGAILAADRFIRLNPQSPSVDYAYYIKGIAHYNLDANISSQYLPLVDIEARDPGMMRQAFEDFAELLIRYPESDYAPDARQRMIEIRNRLAQYELHAARYYIKREAYLAAANRAAHIVENFPNTPAVEDALIVMVETYRLLGLEGQANDALAVLKASFGSGKGFDEEGQFVAQYINKQNRNLLNVMTFGLLN